MQEKTAAVVLAAGKGKRMNSDVPKQFMLLREKPVLYYSLQTFQDSFVDEIILVTEKGEEEYCRKEIVDKYHLTKVKHITAGLLRKKKSCVQREFRSRMMPWQWKPCFTNP